MWVYVYNTTVCTAHQTENHSPHFDYASFVSQLSCCSVRYSTQRHATLFTCVYVRVFQRFGRLEIKKKQNSFEKEKYEAKIQTKKRFHHSNAKHVIVHSVHYQCTISTSNQLSGPHFYFVNVTRCVCIDCDWEKQTSLSVIADFFAKLLVFGCCVRNRAWQSPTECRKKKKKETISICMFVQCVVCYIAEMMCDWLKSVENF